MLDIYNVRNVQTQSKRTVRYTSIVGAFLAVLTVWQSTPFHWGLLIGTMVGMTNNIILYFQFRKVLDLSFKEAIAYVRMGFSVRLLLIMIVLFISVRTDVWDIYGLAFGIFIAPIITVVDFNISLLKDYKAQFKKNKN